MTTGAGRALRWLLTVTVFVLLAMFARRVDWGATWVVVRHADPVVLLMATLVNLLSLALKGVRWWIFLRPVGARPLGLALRATFAGAGLNNVLIAQGGEAARVILVARAAHISTEPVLAALTVERLLDGVTYLSLLVGAAFVLDMPEPIARWRRVASLALVAAVGAVAVLVGRASAAVRVPVVDAVDAVDAVDIEPPATLGARARAYAARFVADLGAVASPSRLGGAMARSAGAWVLQVATYHLTARAAHLPLPLAGSVAVLLAVGIGFLVRATPGNVGLFQVVYALTAGSFGVARDPAVAVALLIQMLQVIPTTVIGIALAPRLVLAGRSRSRATLER